MSRDLTQGNPWRSIWQMSWPMLLIMILNFLIGFTDVYVAGLIAPEVQAAVGYVGQIYFLLIIIANAISIGTLALVSRAVGAGDRDRACGVARQSLLLSIVIATTLTVASFFLAKPIVSLAGLPSGIIPIAEAFWAIFALALGPNYLLIISNAIFRASGEVQKPLLTMLLVCIINVAGDFILVFGLGPLPPLGYSGIAIATAVSVTAGMLLNLFFLGSEKWKGIFIRPFGLSGETIVKVARLGWPAAFLQIAWNAGTIVLYTVLGRLGEKSIAALASITNGLRIEAIIFLPAFALNMAASVLIGQNLGAGNAERAERLGWRIAYAGIGFVSVLSAVIFIFAHELSEFLSADKGVQEETARYLRITMISEPFMALSAILGGSLQGAGDTRGTMWVIIIAMWMIRLPLAYLLGITAGYGAPGVWVAMVTSMVVQGIMMAVRYKKGAWKSLRVG